jgi:nucleoside-diphosphate-sugar epimerase
MESFYRSIRSGTAAPTPPEALVEGVAVWEEVAKAFEAAALEAEVSLGAESSSEQRVVLTGGTGFLGVETAKRLLSDGFAVRILARRIPAPWERIAGAEYVASDLGGGVDPDLLRGAAAVVHCAAETAGSWEEHQRNSIDATTNLLRAAAQAGVPRFVHVSSMGVLRSGNRPVSESSPVEADSRGRGPYVWGKLESEIAAQALAAELGIDLRVLRPGAIIDSREFDPPGRLGKAIGPIFVAVGSSRGSFGTVDRGFAAEVISWTVGHFDEVPAMVNLTDAELPMRGELVGRLRLTNPDLRVIWLPFPILLPLSGLAILLQKVLRPRGKAINVARVFANQKLDTTVIRGIRERMATRAASEDQTAASTEELVGAGVSAAR